MMEEVKRQGGERERDRLRIAGDDEKNHLNKKKTGSGHEYRGCYA